MNLTVIPGSPLHGEMTLPGDKSLSHRAALFAALAEGESCIENFLVSGVTRSMLAPLAALGVPWELEGTRLTVAGRGLHGLKAPSEPLYCGNSATTMRLLAGALAAAGIAAVLDGSPGLRRRPMNRIVEPLRAMGVPIEASPGGCAPLTLAARPASQKLRGLRHELTVASAQVKTALLLAGLDADGPTTIVEPAPSRDHTERMLASMGVEVSGQWAVGSGQSAVGSGRSAVGSGQFSSANSTMTITTLYPPSFRLHPSSFILHPSSFPLHPLNLALPGDISSAAFLIVAALITPGSQLILREVGLNPTRSGLLDALAAMGADIQIHASGLRHGEPLGDLTVQFSSLHGTQIAGAQVVRMMDEFPIFAVAAACADSQTIVRDAAELRYKESDRIAALCESLRALGVDIRETPDGFYLPGNTPPQGGTAQSCGDHRLAMSLTVAGLAAHQPVRVEGAEMMAESFPGFVETLRALGANLQTQN